MNRPPQPDCVFCRIERGDLPAQKLFEDEQLFVIRDIAPQARTHLLVIPRRHIGSMLELTAADAGLLGNLMTRARAAAEQEGLTDGYRLVINNGTNAGQEVAHLHLHVLGGEQLGPMTPPRRTSA